MRFEPIERPPGLLLRFAYWLSKRRLGRVMSSLSVLYPRAPALALPTSIIAWTMEKRLSLDPETILLVTTQSSMINGCTFCADLHMAQAVQARLGLAKFKALPEFATSPVFSERERAVLAYTEEITRTRNVSDATFESLRKHVNEQQVIEITWLNAIGNFFNLMGVPLGLESDGLTEIALRRVQGGSASVRA
jgi:AhpD family alkylhydroperoxidase